jgi:hypothetical protein
MTNLDQNMTGPVGIQGGDYNECLGGGISGSQGSFKIVDPKSHLFSNLADVFRFKLYDSIRAYRGKLISNKL